MFKYQILFILFLLIACGEKKSEDFSIYRSNEVNLSGSLENCRNCLIVEESDDSKRMRVLIQNLDEINYSYCEDEYIFYKENETSLLSINGINSYSLEHNDTRGCLDRLQLFTIEKTDDDLFFTIELLKFKLEKVK